MDIETKIEKLMNGDIYRENFIYIKTHTHTRLYLHLSIYSSMHIHVCMYIYGGTQGNERGHKVAPSGAAWR